MRRHGDLIDFIKSTGIDTGKSVLDVGCGRGTLARLMRDSGFQDIHGTDWLDPADIERENPNALSSYIKLDLNEDGLSDAFDRKFDLIVCSDTLEHLERPAAVLRSMAALLSEAGSLYVTLPNAANIFQRISWLLTGNSYRYRMEKPGEFGHIALFPSQVMASLLERAGLECVRRGKGFAAFAGFITRPGWRFGEMWSYVNYYEIKKRRRR